MIKGVCKMKRIISLIIALLMLCAAFSACNAKTPEPVLSEKSKNLTADIIPVSQKGTPADDRFITAVADFGVSLYNASEKDTNTLVSPLSVLTAMAMTANGAKGETLSQIEAAFGNITIDELNRYIKAYADSLPSGDSFKLSQANSIWIKNNAFEANTDFLQRACDYYNAAIYNSAFDSDTVKDINSWVESHTDKMIKKIIDSISPDSVMFLINAVCFDSKWEEKYTDDDVIEDKVFHGVNGDGKCTLMYSDESSYINGSDVTGFIKYYKGRKYAFVAFLPQEGLAPDEWLSGQDGQSIISLIKNAKEDSVRCAMPKFKYEYETSLNDALKTLGITDAFRESTADFSEMGRHVDGYKIYIGGVIHKTFIDNNESGTKAAAVTIVDMTTESVPAEPPHRVILDRPFAYAIIDTATSLPIFIGTVNEISY